MKKNKGFTMVEILAVIVLIGILSGIAISATMSILQRMKREYYISTLNNLKSAAQSYTEANRKYLPKAVGRSTKITLKELKEAKYLEDIKDYSKKSCDEEKTFVTIFRYSKTGYLIGNKTILWKSTLLE